MSGAHIAALNSSWARQALFPERAERQRLRAGWLQAELPEGHNRGPKSKIVEQDGFDLNPSCRSAQLPLAGFAGLIKRAKDLVFSLLGLAILAVPLMLIALAIKLDSPGPVLFRQRRTGFLGEEFEILKFRTMHHHSADPGARQQTRREDPRITRIGALLRRTSVDELPQLFNVLRGEMSLVGPRPHAPGTRAGTVCFRQVSRRYTARHLVRPGLTGLAQVRGQRGATKTEAQLLQRIASDLEYIATWSPWLDLRILVATAWAVLRMENAY
ncbi:MAG: sugar transferase [Acetobacteraceae bacterium]|nr:sugar transferase [Acetobacteraceae bacterium]